MRVENNNGRVITNLSQLKTGEVFKADGFSGLFLMCDNKTAFKESGESKAIVDLADNIVVPLNLVMSCVKGKQIRVLDDIKIVIRDERGAKE